MKILVIGDFHGKFPLKLKNKLKKEKFDLTVGLGDYFPFGARKLFFKHCYGTNKELWEVIGKKKFKRIELNDRKQGRKILELLDKTYSNIISITGNLDRTKWNEAHKDYDKLIKKKWSWVEEEFFSKASKNLKNIKFFDWSFAKFGGYIFIGYPISNFPGHVQSKGYRNQRKKLDKLFHKFKKENKEGKLIFVSHNVPYETKLDMIKPKIKYRIIKRRHYGSKLAKRIINKWQPKLTLCGHIHENPGKDKIDKSLIVNPGAAQDGRAAIINLPEDSKKKIKVKFIK